MDVREIQTIDQIGAVEAQILGAKINVYPGPRFDRSRHSTEIGSTLENTDSEPAEGELGGRRKAVVTATDHDDIEVSVPGRG